MKEGPCFDAEDTNSTWVNEPMPNGGRVNLGAYGNTGEALKTLTNEIHSLFTVSAYGVLCFVKRMWDGRVGIPKSDLGANGI